MNRFFREIVVVTAGPIVWAIVRKDCLTGEEWVFLLTEDKPLQGTPDDFSKGEIASLHLQINFGLELLRKEYGRSKHTYYNI